MIIVKQSKYILNKVVPGDLFNDNQSNQQQQTKVFRRPTISNNSAIKYSSEHSPTRPQDNTKLASEISGKTKTSPSNTKKHTSKRTTKHRSNSNVEKSDTKPIEELDVNENTTQNGLLTSLSDLDKILFGIIGVLFLYLFFYR